MNADDAYAHRVGLLEMRERCAELAEAKAKTVRASANGHTHYGAQQNAVADELEGLAAAMRLLPLVNDTATVVSDSAQDPPR